MLTAGHEEDEPGAPRVPSLSINNVFGMLRAAESGLGLASLPDYLGFASGTLQRVLDHLEGPSFTAYFVYPEELKTSKRGRCVPRLPAREGGRAAGLVEARCRTWPAFRMAAMQT